MIGERGLRWRKAMIFSLVFHCIVLVGVGWLTATVLSPAETTETLIELEFASEPEGAPLPASSPETVPAQSSQPIVASVPVVQQRQPQIQPEAVVPEPAAAVSSMSAAVAGAGADSGQATAIGGGGTGAAGSGAGSGGGQGNDKGMIGPSILSPQKPPYPEKSRRERQEGTVVLQIEILENGRAREVRVKQSSGYELLDKAAVDSVKSWRFVPAKNRATGKAVVCTTSLPIVFRLK